MYASSFAEHSFERLVEARLMSGRHMRDIGLRPGHCIRLATALGQQAATEQGTCVDTLLEAPALRG
eukprot:715641-Pyramimonas_sp.AAC.1